MRRLAALLLVLAACSSGGTAQQGGGHEDAAMCAPSGTTLSIKAQRNIFDTKCLAAPAAQAFTIAFDNRDSAEPHNVAIFDQDPMEKQDARVLFRGEEFTGPKTVTYRVGALAAGEYHFHCDVHPRVMFGMLIVR